MHMHNLSIPFNADKSLWNVTNWAFKEMHWFPIKITRISTGKWFFSTVKQQHSVLSAWWQRSAVLQFQVKTKMTWLQPQEGCISHGGWHTFCHTKFIHWLWFQMLASAHNTCHALPTQRCPSPFQPPTTPHNMSDQWQQPDPVGNKGYEVWQWCARWSPSSCLFLQAMGSQTEEWKSGQYIDFRGGEFVSPSGILMNQNGHLASCRCMCTRSLSPLVDGKDFISQ